jgi:spore coat protein CotH
VLIPDAPVPNDNLDGVVDALDDPNYERLFSDDDMKSMTIEITRSNYNVLDTLMIEHQQQFGDYKSDAYVQANVIYEDSQGLLSLQHIGFRTRGNLSRNRIQDDEGHLIINHYKLKFDETFNDTLDVSKRFMFGLEELDLKYNRNADETYMNEHYALSLYRSFDVYAQRSTHLMVYIKIDGYTHKMGLYTAFEPIDKTFIERRFEGQHATGDLYKSLWQQYGPALLTYPQDLNAIGIKNASINYRPSYDLKTNKDTSMHESLIAFMIGMSLELSARQLFLETYVDLDYMARFFAVSLILGNPDDIRSNGNNYYVYHDPVDQLFYIIPYDLDHSLGQGWDGAPAFENQLVNTPIYEYPRFMDYVLSESPNSAFVDGLFSLNAFQMSYENTLEQIVTSDIFSMTHVKQMIDTLQMNYQFVIVGSMLDVSIGYRNIESYIQGKIQSVLQQLT